MSLHHTVDIVQHICGCKDFVIVCTELFSSIILNKNVTSLIDVNIIPCQLVPHLVDQGIPNPRQVHQIHVVSQMQQHSWQRKPF